MNSPGQPKTAATVDPVVDSAVKPKSLPPLADKANDLAALRDAVVESAGVGAGLWISYLGVLLYLLVAAGGVSHKDLFFETPAKLPFLSVDLPLVGFFVLAPGLFLIVHAYVLLHFGLLSSKVSVFDRALRDQIEDITLRTQLRRQLPSNIFVQFLAGPRDVRDGLIGLMLWLIALITLVIGPVALLVFLNLQFLPYHDEAVTWWQRVAVGLDLLLVWLFWPRVAGLGHATEDQAGTTGRMATVQRGLTWVVMYVLTGLSTLLLLVFATFPGEGLDSLLWPRDDPWMPNAMRSARVALITGDVNPATRKPQSMWSNRLVLPGLNVLTEKKLDTEEKLAAVPSSISLRNRNLNGAVLSGANLRKADLVGASLNGAFLIETDLSEARLECATNWISGEPSRPAATTRAICARLHDAYLGAARLSGVSASGAEFHGADMPQVELFGAMLTETSFAGANLSLAKFDGSIATGAIFHAANMWKVSLRGAILLRAEFQAADLTEARLGGAMLNEANLQGAKLDRAVLSGTSLREAYVWRADLVTASVTASDMRSRPADRARPCVNPGRTGDCQWTVDDLTAWQQIVAQPVSLEWLRRFIADRMATQLDPRKPGYDAVRDWWRDTHQRPITEEAFLSAVAREWEQVGCQITGSPYVSAGMAAGAITVWTEEPLYRKLLATRLLDDRCVGAKGLKADLRARLRELLESPDPPNR